MLSLSGYVIKESLAQTETSLVLRAVRARDLRPVILKVLRDEFAQPEKVTRFKREFDILQRFKDHEAGVVKVLDLEKHGHRWVLVLDDFEGRTLDQVLKDRRPEVARVVRWAIRLTSILDSVHRQDIIHKDLNPSNILWNESRDDLELIDFGIATLLSRENPAPTHPNVVEGTLKYMSPEQTGRMNRSMDYRTDFYSFGVTLYELLTGRVPFESSDALELVHSHLARVPVPPREINPDIPSSLSRVTMKLLSKNAEDRYQSMAGLRADLERCLGPLGSPEASDDMPLGQDDHSHHFQIHQKLYGREAELSTIMERFAAVSAGATELLLVSGYSGIGKSSLVNEVYKPITQKRGYFIAGKFDQFQRNVPYSAIIRAFQDLVRQLLTESAEEVAAWRQRLLSALVPNGNVIIDVIAELRMIIGPQPPAEPLGPAEAQNRFNLVFQNFIRVFCQAEHPLVIFLDDLQWADPASLKLLDVAVTDDQTRYLLMIGAYRDNDVGPTHPFVLTLESLRKRGASVHEITLAPLSLGTIGQLIADTTRRSAAEVEPLAALVFRKSGGNPFFVNQFLRTLHQEDLLSFDHHRHCWVWRLAQIEAQSITDNVVDLVIAKLRRLPEEAQATLRLAACVGNSFDLDTLAIIHQKPAAATFADLLPTLRDGFVLPTSEFAVTHDDLRDAALVIHHFKFLHDRVQQAAYALIDDAHKQEVHLQIGRLLLANLTVEAREERVFELVDHLNQGRARITDQAERTELSGLNALAGRKAQSAMVHDVALRYFGVGMDLLPEGSWSSAYELSLGLHRESGRSAYLNGEFERAFPLLDKALACARSPFDREEIYRVKMNAFMTRGQFLEGIRVGYEALRLFDVDLPDQPADINARLSQERAALEAKLSGRRIADLYDHPAMADEGKRVALELLIELWALAYLGVQPNLLSLCTTTMTNMSLDLGHAKSSSFGYISYGMQVAIKGDYETAYELGHLALRLNDKYQHRGVIGKTINLFCHSQNPYREPLRTNIPLYERSHQACMECGDLLYGVWALFFNIYTRLLSGDPLPEISAHAKGFLPTVKKVGDENMLLAYQTLQRAVLSLEGKTRGDLDLDDEEFNLARATEVWTHNGFDSGINWSAYLRMQLACIYDLPQVAFDLGQEVAPKIVANFGFFPQTTHNFYHSLSAAALWTGASPERRAELRKIIEDNQVRMRRWADNGPSNFLQTHLLVEAELARIDDRTVDAMELYERAIEAASSQDCLHVEALGNELSGRFWLSRGKEAIARVYLTRARDAYQAWGAARKVAKLIDRYPSLRVASRLEPPSLRTATIRADGTSAVTRMTKHVELDLGAIVKASQAISSEIALPRLLEKLLVILLENAGAERGMLIMERDQRWGIEGQVTAGGQAAKILEGIPVESADDIAVGVVNYVTRTLEPVVLSDASLEGAFTRDPYVAERKPRSVLCLPLVNQGKLVGLVYLENNLLPAAFSPDRVETLRLLGAQAAVSLENARLYENLERNNRTLESRVDERTRDLSHALESLRAAQQQMIQSEKLAALGQLIGTIAHEINTPLGVIRASADNLASSLGDTIKQWPMVLQCLSPERQSQFFSLVEAALTSRESLSSKEERARKRTLTGVLEASGVPDPRQAADLLIAMGIEENIEPFLSLLSDPHGALSLQLAYNLCTQNRKGDEIRTAVERAAKIVFALKSYARYDQRGQPVMAGLLDGIEVVLTLYSNQTRRDVEVIRDYKARPVLSCYPDQLVQVWTNLVHNALQAMNYKGRMQISVESEGGFAVVKITDSGAGIPESIGARIFEPFFTTKTMGEGSGLGLDIVRKIVDKHGGGVDFQSRPGATTFTVRLPCA